MNLNEVVEGLLKKKYQLNMGAGSLSKRYGVNKELIYEAKKKAKEILNTEKLLDQPIPKILIFDIETSPTIAFTWRRFKENISLPQVLQDPIMLTWSAKWLFSDEVLSDKISVEEVKKYDDKRIVTSLWELVDKADIVIAHYGDNFDVPMLNTRALANGLHPYNPIKSIDTKKVASMTFNFPSNKLDGIALYFGLQVKLGTNFNLWKNCLVGSDETRQQSITDMSTYNDQDVIVLEEVYLKLRPYIKGHPNMGVYMELDTPVCRNCGSTHVSPTNKFYYTQTGKFETYKCVCGTISRRRLNSYDKEKKEELLTSV